MKKTILILIILIAGIQQVTAGCIHKISNKNHARNCNRQEIHRPGSAFIEENPDIFLMSMTKDLNKTKDRRPLIIGR